MVHLKKQYPYRLFLPKKDDFIFKTIDHHDFRSAQSVYVRVHYQIYIECTYGECMFYMAVNAAFNGSLRVQDVHYQTQGSYMLTVCIHVYVLDMYLYDLWSAFVSKLVVRKETWYTCKYGCKWFVQESTNMYLLWTNVESGFFLFILYISIRYYVEEHCF